MHDRVPPPRSRPRGVAILAALLALWALGALSGFTVLFPVWLAAARQHHYLSGSLAWVQLLTALSAFGAAYGLWHGRRWARMPAALLVASALGTSILAAAFGSGEAGTREAWLTVGVLFVILLSLSSWLLRYVWRNT